MLFAQCPRCQYKSSAEVTNECFSCSHLVAFSEMCCSNCDCSVDVWMCSECSTISDKDEWIQVEGNLGKALYEEELKRTWFREGFYP